MLSIERGGCDTVLLHLIYLLLKLKIQSFFYFFFKPSYRKNNLACLAKIVSIKNSSAVPSLLVLGLEELEAFRNRPGFSLTDLNRFMI